MSARTEFPGGNGGGGGDLTGSPLDVVRTRTESVGGLLLVAVAVVVVVLLAGD